jgi:hypothetical protein
MLVEDENLGRKLTLTTGPRRLIAHLRYAVDDVKTFYNVYIPTVGSQEHCQM